MKRIRSVYLFVLTQLLILVVCLLPAFFCDIDLSAAFKFFAVQLSAVFLPGLAVYLKTNRKRMDTVSFNLYPYVFGIPVLMAEYLFCALVKIQIAPFFIFFFVLISSAIYIVLNRDLFSDIEEDHSYLILLLLFLFISIICFFSISMSNPLPTAFGKMAYNKDFLFWVGNSISFTKGLPVQNFRLAGLAFHYHYFSNIVIAQLSLITKINVWTLSYYFTYAIPCLMLVLSAYRLFSRLSENKWLIFIGLTALLIAEGSTTFYADHLYFCPFGFDYAYAYAMLQIEQIIYMYRENNYSSIEIAISGLFVILATGFKGPVALIALMGNGIVAFGLLFEKKWKEGFICGTVWLLSFLLVYFFCISYISSGVEEANDLMILGPSASFDKNPWAIEILSELIEKWHFPNNGVSRIIALFLYVFRSNKGGMFLLITASVVEIINVIKKRQFSLIDDALIMICIWGILLTICTYQDGHSQMYFIMSVFPFAVSSGLSAIERIEYDRMKLILVLELLLMLMSFSDIRRFVCERAYAEVKNAISTSHGTQLITDQRYCFTEEEYELSLWLKENTKSKDYIVLDSFSYDGLRKEEGFGVFSERFIWNDGQYSDEKEKNRRRSLVEKVLTEDEHDVSLLTKEGVKYFILTLSQNPNFVLKNSKIVYSSKNYIIYKLH